MFQQTVNFWWKLHISNFVFHQLPSCVHLFLFFCSLFSFHSDSSLLDHQPSWNISLSPGCQCFIQMFGSGSSSPGRFSFFSPLPSLHVIMSLSPAVVLSVSPICVNAALPPMCVCVPCLPGLRGWEEVVWIRCHINFTYVLWSTHIKDFVIVICILCFHQSIQSIACLSTIPEDFPIFSTVKMAFLGGVYPYPNRGANGTRCHALYRL